MANNARLYLFGGFRLVGSNGRPVHVKARKGQALIAYLACTPGGASTREKLATLFWSESDNSHARESLRGELSKLRRDLGDQDRDMLQSEVESLALRTDRLWIDAREFEIEFLGASHTQLERAAKRYAGDLLDGLVCDAPLFEEWLTVERDRFRERAIACLRAILARHVSARAFDRGIEIANRILEIDPCLEDVHRALMEIYLTMSMRTSAMRQYERCRAALRRELVVEPDHATAAVFRRCLNPDTPSLVRRSDTAWRTAPIDRSLQVLAEPLSVSDTSLQQKLMAAQADVDRGARATARVMLRGLLHSLIRLGKGPQGEALAWRVRLLLAEIAEAEGEIGRVHRQLRALERSTDTRVEPGERVRLFYALSRVSQRAQRDDDARHYARQALQAARETRTGVWLLAERILFRAHLLDGRHREAARRLSTYVDRANQLRLPRSEASAAKALAVILALEGRFDRADRHANRALCVVEEIDDARLLAGTLTILGLIRCWAKDPIGALAALDRAWDLAAGAGDLIRAHVVLGHRGVALLDAERAEEAVADLRQAVAVAKALGMRAYLPMFAAGLAAASDAVGDRAAAEFHARVAWRAATAANRPWARGCALRTLASRRSVGKRAADWIVEERRAFGIEAPLA